MLIYKTHRAVKPRLMNAVCSVRKSTSAGIHKRGRCLDWCWQYALVL